MVKGTEKGEENQRRGQGKKTSCLKFKIGGGKMDVKKKEREGGEEFWRAGESRGVQR